LIGGKKRVRVRVRVRVFIINSYTSPETIMTN
jgi:hypothetical protein